MRTAAAMTRDVTLVMMPMAVSLRAIDTRRIQLLTDIGFILHDPGEAQELRAEQDARAMHRVEIDGEPHGAFVDHELGHTAMLRELVEIADREDRLARDRLEQRGRSGRVEPRREEQAARGEVR